MKKHRSLLVTCIAIVLVCICGCGCNHAQTDDMDYEEILKTTWDQMEEKERSVITGSWEDGKVEIITVQMNGNVQKYYVEDGYIGIELYLVSFPTADSDFVGDITKLVDMESLRIVGYGFRN